jgi:hypothetical protein
MATEKQIIANQQNAKHSTGPRTESGKRRSRRNAIRHGLTAETVIDTLEDATHYMAFERAIKSDYSPQTAIEGQLVSRLASLLWRLRRAVIVESGMLTMQAEMICNQGASRPTELNIATIKQQEAREDIRVDSIHSDKARTTQTNTNIARAFLRLTGLDDGAFERLGRYETNLWRQTAQILLLLNSIEFCATDRFPDERPHFRRVRRKHGRYPPFDFNPFFRSAGRLG